MFTLKLGALDILLLITGFRYEIQTALSINIHVYYFMISSVNLRFILCETLKI